MGEPVEQCAHGVTLDAKVFFRGDRATPAQNLHLTAADLYTEACAVKTVAQIKTAPFNTLTAIFGLVV